VRANFPSGLLDALDQIRRRINRGVSLGWFAHVEIGEGLVVFEEVPSLSGDLRARDVAGEGVLHR
jgi:hypothetical protein